MWAIQRIALRTKHWGPVITSQLASNAFGRVVPGGVAASGAMQYAMLVRAGVPVGAGGVGDDRLVGAGVRHPAARCRVLAVPAILGGAPVDPGLGGGADRRRWCSSCCSPLGAACLALGPPAAGVGRAAQWVRNRVLRQARAADQPAGAAAARARRGAGGARAQLVAGAAVLVRPLGARLPDAARRARRRGRPPAPVAGAARLLRRPAARHAAAHARRARLRRGGADGNARARRRGRRQRGAWPRWPTGSCRSGCRSRRAAWPPWSTGGATARDGEPASGAGG